MGLEFRSKEMRVLCKDADAASFVKRTGSPVLK